jgi:hypothetical protein
MRTRMKATGKTGKISLGAVSVLFAASVAACGGDSTVDNDSTEVPSVAAESGSDSSSEAPESGAAESETPSSDAAESDAAESDAAESDAADGGNDSAPGGENAPQDGGVEEVEEPGGEPAPRSDEDDAFLSQLKDNGIDVTDSDIQDQIIASGREQCLANEEDRDSFAVPMIAGQLEAQKLTDVDPEEAGRIIAESAEAHYCG